MQTITPITNAGDAANYFKKDDYYTRDQSGGRAWMGKGAHTLNLNEVDLPTFQAILEGKDAQGNVLVEAASNGKHRVGWDLHFAPSKSVSLVWAFGSEEQRAHMMDAHHAAVESVMKYVEDNLVEARGRADGTTRRMGTGNMIAARFDHFTSREMDPQVHSHVVVANMTQRKDGKWRAVANEKIFARELLTAMYENELAAELKERGYTVTMAKYDTGNSRYARIEGIDGRIEDHFAKRQSQIDKAMETLKEHFPLATAGELRQMACLDTRQAKKSIDREVLHESWDRQLESIGFSKGYIAESLARQSEYRKPEGLVLTAQGTIKMASSALNEQESTFTREDIMKTAARISGGTHRNKALEDAFIRLKGKSIVTLDKDAGVYTTREMTAIENGIVTAVDEGRGTIPAVLDTIQVQERTRELHDYLTADQKKALEHILTSQDRVIGIQGDAGTGKTSMLHAAREELERKGYIVRGMTFTGKASKELQTGAGVESQTLHSFLPKAQTPEFTPSEKEAWFVDEVSMVGSKQMGELVNAAKKANARVILVGDTKQLQSIEAGRMFQKLQESGAMKMVHMKETLRQKDEEYKEIVSDIAERRIDQAFTRMQDRSKVHEIVDDTDRREAIVKEFVSQKDYGNTLVVTPLNKDRGELNRHIRGKLRDKGAFTQPDHTFAVREPKVIPPVERHFAQSYSPGDIVAVNKSLPGFRLGDQGRVTSIDAQNQEISIVTVYGQNVSIDVSKHGHKLGIYQERLLPFTQGEKIVFLKNDKNLGVQNGLTGEIKSLDERGNLTVKIDTGKDVTFSIPRSYNYLDHGYAVTDYKSQGQTSKRVIFHANTEKPTSYNSFYVAMTRGKDDLRVYTNGAEKLREQVKKEITKTSSLDYATKIIPRPPIQKAPVRAPQIHIGREGR
mgnify:CR=1 FL=1